MILIKIKTRNQSLEHYRRMKRSMARRSQVIRKAKIPKNPSTVVEKRTTKIKKGRGKKKRKPRRKDTSRNWKKWQQKRRQRK